LPEHSILRGLDKLSKIEHIASVKIDVAIATRACYILSINKGDTHMSKDFTRQQADQWVVQELAKHPTPDSVRARIASEEALLSMLAGSGLDKKLPNSTRAHQDLLTALREAIN
jgi:hypothetical protein